MISKLRGLKFIEIYSVSVKCSKIRGLKGGSESADTPDSGDESDAS